MRPYCTKFVYPNFMLKSSGWVGGQQDFGVSPSPLGLIWVGTGLDWDLGLGLDNSDSEANSLCETHGLQNAKCSCFAIYFSVGTVYYKLRFYFEKETYNYFRDGWILRFLDHAIRHCNCL